MADFPIAVGSGALAIARQTPTVVQESINLIGFDGRLDDLVVLGHIVSPEVLPELTLTATMITGELAEIELLLPDLEVSGALSSGYIFTGNITLPELTLFATDGAVGAALLPVIEMDSAVLSGTVGDSECLLLSIQGTGTVLSEVVYSASNLLPNLVVSAASTTGTMVSAAITVPGLTLSASGYSGVVATSAVELPDITLSAELYSDITMDGALVLSILVLDAIGVTDSGSIVYAATPARVMNVSNKAITEYTNYRFNSFASVGSRNFGASDTGIYLLSGDNDAGSSINSRVVLGVTDFSSSYYKRVEYAYIAYNTDGNMRLKLTTDSNDTFEYFMAPTGKTRHHSVRVSLARGARTRYIQPELLNDSGADFTISKIELVGAISNKRM